MVHVSVHQPLERRREERHEDESGDDTDGDSPPGRRLRAGEREDADGQRGDHEEPEPDAQDADRPAT